MKVGIVIVSYNAELAVRATLASVRRAKTAIPHEVILIDNASAPAERERIERAFERHHRELGDAWTFLPQAANLGFSGGNNVGIRQLLDRPDITHICLLNSDVLVPDGWLDRLVEKDVAIVSAVTNKADSAQCVPVDYALDLDDCLAPGEESLTAVAVERVNAFAQGRRRAFEGCLVESDPTFFCVLLSREVVRVVGLLDETFFPGGYEDNDYCIRAREAGYKLYLARDCYIHHWGSASFGQLAHEYHSSKSKGNIRYLEEKHGIVLQRHPEAPLLSYESDYLWALGAPVDRSDLSSLNQLYRASLIPLVAQFKSQYLGLKQHADQASAELPQALEQRMQRVDASPDPEAGLSSAIRRVDDMLSRASCGESEVDTLRADLSGIIACVHDMALSSLEIHAVLFKGDPKSDREAAVAGLCERVSPIRKLRWLLSRGGRFLWGFRGIVFFGGYPYPERQSDGYFQRIQIVDGLFTDYWRVYVESTELPGRDRWLDRPAERVLVLRVLGGRRRRVLVRVLAHIAALRCRRIYFHSVLRMRDQGFGRLMYLPWLRKAIDVHGVVPEEFRFHNDFYSASLYDKEERVAVKHANLAIVVSHAMEGYLRQKYREALRAEVAVFPMFPSLIPESLPLAYDDGRPTVVYAGGLHRWQQVPKMIDAIVRSHPFCRHRFYCPEPDKVLMMLPAAIRDEVVVERKDHAELMALYNECHFGFLLREDVVVNHVSCPTKAVEYLGRGVVPILDNEDVGDFKSLGMQFVTLADLLAGRLPDEAERNAMAKANLEVYDRLRVLRDTGARAIRDQFSYPERTSWRRRIRGRLARWLPPDTRRGALARRIARRPGQASGSSRQMQEVSRPLDVSGLPERCDVLMQVDNFEAGGLENVVLDLSLMLRDAGYQVVLAVLGDAGAGVQRAREQGTPVAVFSKSETSYATLLAHLGPKLALTHYSTFGAAACARAGIPFVQVIHNTYMWLSASQLKALRDSAPHTTLFVAVSDYARRYSVHRLGLDPEKCVTIPNGIDTTQYSDFDAGVERPETRARLGIGDEDYVFLSVGSVNHQKNHIAAVSAFADASGDMPGARLVILGPVYEPPLLEELETLIAARGLGERILYAGSAKSAHPYYAMADAFVSSAYFEGGQLTLLEAVSANLSVITTEIGFGQHFRGLPGIELVEPPFDIVRFQGSLIDMSFGPDLVDRLAQAMRRTYRDRERPNLSQQIIKALDKRNAYACYLDLIASLIEGRGWESAPCDRAWPQQLATARETAVTR